MSHGSQIATMGRIGNARSISTLGKIISQISIITIVKKRIVYASRQLSLRRLTRR